MPDGTSKDSRVDILINTKNKDIRYLIEVKIYDQSHHFGQYETAYGVPKERLGYITNYRCKKEGYVIKNWETFYFSCCKESPHPMIKAYGEYLNNVCGIDKYHSPMMLTSHDSEECFSDTAQKIIENYVGELATRYDKKYPDKCAFGFACGRNELNGYAIFYFYCPLNNKDVSPTS